MWICGQTSVSSYFFAFFPLIFTERSRKYLLFHVNFARNSGFPHFRTSFHTLLKTFPKTPQFPQFRQNIRRMSYVEPVRGLMFPTNAGKGKNHLEITSEKLKIAEKPLISPIFRKNGQFHVIFTPGNLQRAEKRHTISQENPQKSGARFFQKFPLQHIKRAFLQI